MNKKDLAKYTRIKKLVHDMLDTAITYGEYILPKETMEKLAEATDYTLPDRDQ